MSDQQEFGWLDELFDKYVQTLKPFKDNSPTAYSSVKAAIQARFTAQTQPLPSIHMNDVNGIDCPACGHPTLMLMSGNYITCCMADCPNPDYTDALAKQHQAELLRARIETNKEILKFIPALQKHSGASWQRGYVSAQQTLRNNIKKNIAYLQTELVKLQNELTKMEGER